MAMAGIGAAILGVLTGLAWKFPAVGRVDRDLFRAVNSAPLPAWADGILRAVRPLGTSWALVVLAGLVATWRPLAGASLLGLGLISGGIERLIKVSVRRTRPFSSEPGVQIRLPPPPRDPSFPSGDASRAWYLAGAILAGLSAAPPVGAAACALAALVSLSRVRGGVHFPADVWAGSWLGLGMGLLWAWTASWIRARFG